MSWYIGLYERTGIMAEPWVKAGYSALCVDINNEEGERDGITFVKADMRMWVPPREIVLEGAVFVSAFPPCDHLAISGARWFKGKGLRALSSSIELFERATFWCEWFGAPYFIENPVSTIKTYWRSPDHYFDPYEFGGYLPVYDVHPIWPKQFPAQDAYYKKTCLWTGHNFVMPTANPILPEDENTFHSSKRRQSKQGGRGKQHKLLRSSTPRGFSEAVWLANDPKLGNDTNRKKTK